MRPMQAQGENSKAELEALEGLLVGLSAEAKQKVRGQAFPLTDLTCA